MMKLSMIYGPIPGHATRMSGIAKAIPKTGRCLWDPLTNPFGLRHFEHATISYNEEMQKSQPLR